MFILFYLRRRRKKKKKKGKIGVWYGGKCTKMKKNMEVGNLNGSGLASWYWILEELMVVI